jgi:hypothetical protein
MTKGLPLPVAVLLVATVCPGALADSPAAKTMIGIKGQCEAASLAGGAARCAPGSGVVYASEYAHRSLWPG